MLYEKQGNQGQISASQLLTGHEKKKLRSMPCVAVWWAVINVADSDASHLTAHACPQSVARHTKLQVLHRACVFGITRPFRASNGENFASQAPG